VHDFYTLEHLDAMDDCVPDDAEPEDEPVDVRHDVAVQPVSRR